MAARRPLGEAVVCAARVAAGRLRAERSVFLRRERSGGHGRDPRLTWWRISVFFLAAGVWLAGVLVDDARVTGAAIVILVVAVVLRMLDRPRQREAEPEDGEP